MKTAQKKRKIPKNANGKKQSAKKPSEKDSKDNNVEAKARTLGGRRTRKKPLDTGLGNLNIAKNRGKNGDKKQNNNDTAGGKNQFQKPKNKSNPKIEKTRKEKKSKNPTKGKKSSKNTTTQSSKLKTIRKKKKKKGARLGDLFPLNIEEEKSKFYDSLKPYAYLVANEQQLEKNKIAVPNPIQCRNYEEVEYATYNPQFAYKFNHDSKIPFSENVDKRFVSIAKRILDATLLYYSKDRSDRVLTGTRARGRKRLSKKRGSSGKNYFYKADNLYYNSFGRVVGREETELEFRYYVEQLGVKFLTEEENIELKQMMAKEELEMLSDITKVNDPFGRAIGVGTGFVEDPNYMKPKRNFDLDNFGLINGQLSGFGAGRNDLIGDISKLSSYKNPKEPQIVLQFSSKSIAPTKVVHTPKSLHSKIVVSLPVIYREKRLTNVLNHEIGTHYCRRYNDYFQFWYGKRGKCNLKGFKSAELLSSEEGLASINQTYEQARSCLGYNWWSSDSENLTDINELSDVGFTIDKKSDSYLSFDHKPTPPFLF